MTLRGLITTRIVISTLLILCLSFAMAIWQARQSVEREVSSSFNLAIQMLDLSFGPQQQHVQTEAELLNRLGGLGETRHLHIVMQNEAGEQVALFTDQSLAQVHLPNWFVRLVMTPALQADYTISLSDSRIKTLQISADPMDEIQEAYQETLYYVISILMILIFIILAVNTVFNTMLKAVREILHGLRRVEAGQYDHALPAFQIGEFDDIATEINRLSTALQHARESTQALTRHSLQIQESERRHMSRELHDEMGQSLTAIKAMAVTVRQPQSNRAEISQAIVQICNRLSEVVRSMMKNLHPLSLAELGLEATLSDLCREWQRRQPNLQFHLSCDDRLETLDEEVAIQLYRVVQECITNIVRHAEASEVWVQLKLMTGHSPARVEITVSDNGQGAANAEGGFGIKGMRERVDTLGGQFYWHSQPGQGTQVRAWVPFLEKLSQE